MPYIRNAAGRGGKRFVPRDPERHREQERSEPAAQAVYNRAFEQVRAVWRTERWKSGVTTKVSAYLVALMRGQKASTPNGVPQRIVQLVQQAIARACLEQGVTGLPVQGASWYDEAANVARTQMNS